MKPTKHILDTEKIRADFPILKRKVHGKPLAYLDNAATSQKPQQVIDAITEYYAEFNANIHRGIHRLSEEATEMYEDAGRKTASFINAGSSEEIIFTKNATESLNLLAYSLTANLEKNDEIVISQMEHHSNLVPWQQIAKQRGFILKYIKINNDGTVVCEIDDVGTGSNGRLVVISREDQTPGQLPGEGAVTFSFASCLPGEVVVGGGYRVTPALVNVFSESSEFSEGAFGWLVNAYYETGTTPGSVTAIAYCATITP